MTSYDYCCDVLIIGSGAAGLTLALRLADRHQITVLSKGSVSESSTLYAQGGVAAVFDEADSLASHISDTLIAGDGLCEQDAVSFIISNAQHCVQWLIDRGMPFDKKHTNSENSPYHLTREAGHSHRRILHRADATGRAVETTLVNRALESPKITIIEYASAVDLIAADKTNRSAERRIVGASIWNSQRQKMAVCRAQVVVLATGGAAKVYRYTSNPDVASGDGIAMSWRAGCRVANLEFSQFHPTSLFHPDARNFLLTEALRGEGAVLKRPDGTRFMPEFDRRAELAPRDIVARAIDHEMKRLGADCMYLDISHKPADFIYAHFPTITEKLSALGFDLTTEPIPVVPAAHYTCGGVIVDRHGRTDVNGLYAIGEVSYTGLHGANRLASNSLLECLVYGWSAATQIDKDLQVAQPVESFPARYETGMNDTGSPVIIRQHLQELRQLMWEDVGIIRTTRQLSHALCRIDSLRQEVEHYYTRSRFCDDVLQLRNLLLVAELIVRCAMQRKESRGLHHTPDYPARLDSSGPTILTPHHRNR